MGIEPGKPLASGRAADVFDQGDGTVLRRYRVDHDTAGEARLMGWLAEQGFPVPAVRFAEGSDLVMELVPGPTMIEDIDRHPWRLPIHFRTLARLQRRLNALQVPDWLPTDPAIPAGRMVLHLDLHPMNVILGPDGPVVIDWTNARRGAGDFDAATSYVIMSAFEVTGARDRLALRIATSSFRRWRGRSAVDRHLAAAAARRLTDSNLTPGERETVERLAAAFDR